MPPAAGVLTGTVTNGLTCEPNVPPVHDMPAAGLDDVPAEVARSTDVMAVAGGSTPQPVATPVSMKWIEAYQSRPKQRGQPP